jgi:glutamine synthetase
VPWDDNVPFFLGEFVWQKTARRNRFHCARGKVARAEARGKAGSHADVRMEFEWFNFADAADMGGQEGVGPEPISAGMFGYSLLRANAAQPFFAALFNETGAFGIPSRVCTRKRARRLRSRDPLSEALEQADRAILFKTAPRRSISPSTSCRASWRNGTPIIPAARDISINRCPTARPTASTTPRVRTDEQAVRELSRGTGRRAHAICADVLADDQQLQAIGRRFLGAGEADVGVDNRTGELSGHSGSPKSRASKRAARGRREPLSRAMAAVIAAGIHGVEKNLADREADHRHQPGRGEHSARAAHADRNTRIFEKSDVARDFLGDEFVDHFAATREWEWRQWLDGVTDWELKRYFEII